MALSSRSIIDIKWEHFYHQADIGVRGIGPTLEDAFEQGAVALTAAVCAPQTIEPASEVSIHCRAGDTELLFVDWLNAVIYEMDTRRMLFSEFRVDIKKNELSAVIRGQKVDTEKHDIAVGVKAATYFMLKVEKLNDGNWLAQCVVDV